jgi:hypothetical protein
MTDDDDDNDGRDNAAACGCVGGGAGSNLSCSTCKQFTAFMHVAWLEDLLERNIRNVDTQDGNGKQSYMGVC